VSIFRFANYSLLFKCKLANGFLCILYCGESLNHGLSPYKNFVHNQPPIWMVSIVTSIVDSCTRTFCKSLSTDCNYSVSCAKWIWGWLELAASWQTFIVAEGFFPAFSYRRVFLSFSLALWYFPLLAHLERGQIDVFTILLITMAIKLWSTYKFWELLSGILLAFAALLKLYVIFFLPFVFLQKRVRVLYGFDWDWHLSLSSLLFSGRCNSPD